jgi:hypothetical protein
MHHAAYITVTLHPVDRYLHREPIVLRLAFMLNLIPRHCLILYENRTLDMGYGQSAPLYT